MISSSGNSFKTIRSFNGVLFSFILIPLIAVFFKCTNNTTLDESTLQYESITVSPTDPTVSIGDQVQFTVEGALLDGSAKDITTTVTWSSSNTAVATISNTDPNKGLVSTMIDGITTITASLDGLNNSTTITVIRPPRGPSSFGFVAKDTGFIFEVNASNFTDNFIIWTDAMNLSTNFFTEWVDGSGVWHAIAGSVSAGDIADEAQDRGLVSGDFLGFEIYGWDADDIIIADGTGTLGTFPGAQIGPIPIPEPLLGVYLFVNGGNGGDEIHGSPEDDILLGGPGEFRDILLGLDGNDFLDGGAEVDAYSGGKGNDRILMEYVDGFGNGSVELVDLNIVGVYGNEGQDTFEITGTASPADQLDALSELAIAKTNGFSDFDNNEDLFIFR